MTWWGKLRGLTHIIASATAEGGEFPLSSRAVSGFGKVHHVTFIPAYLAGHLVNLASLPLHYPRSVYKWDGLIS